MLSEIIRIFVADEDPSFIEFVLGEYLRTGSVGEDIISKTKLQKLLNRYEIVKTAEQKDDFSRTLAFLSYICRPGVSLKTACDKAEKKGLTSNITDVRELVDLIKTGSITRAGTALVVVPQEFPGMVLVGNDVTTPDVQIGKTFMSVSLPMGYSEWDEDPKKRVLRICQRELWSKLTVAHKFPKDVLPKDPKLFMHLKIAHVGVECYFLELPSYLCDPKSFSSDKLVSHRFVPIETLTGDREQRAGVKEITEGYRSSMRDLVMGYRVSPVVGTAEINKLVARIYS